MLTPEIKSQAGRAAYLAAQINLGNKNPCPWECLLEEVRKGWERVAESVYQITKQ